MTPRFVSDAALIKLFGLTKSALKTYRTRRDFPQKNTITKKTDAKAVDRFFDIQSGLVGNNTQPLEPDGMENW